MLAFIISCFQNKNLLTYTGGFGEQNVGIISKHYSERVPLVEYLRDNQFGE